MSEANTQNGKSEVEVCAMKNPDMFTIDSRSFRAWVVERFDSMAEDPDWREDNPADVPQARRIAHSINHGQPIALLDAKRVEEEVIAFEETFLDDRKLWDGAKRFLVESRLVAEFTPEIEAATISTGKAYWFKYRGKKYA